MARPERFELPTTKFVAWYSIQLSYGRTQKHYLTGSVELRVLLQKICQDKTAYY